MYEPRALSLENPAGRVRAVVPTSKALLARFAETARFSALRPTEVVGDLSGVGTPHFGFIRYSQTRKRDGLTFDVAYRCNPTKHFVIGPPRLLLLRHDDYERLLYKCNHCYRNLFSLELDLHAGTYRTVVR